MSLSSFPSPLLPNVALGHRVYVLRTLSLMTVYALINVAAIFGLFDSVLGRPAAWLLALAVGVPVAGQLWATLRLIADSDEYLRAMLAKRFILSAGIAMALWSVWGFGESYAGAAHLQGWLIYPLFWVISAVVSLFIRSSQS